jgi:uncharacterized protein (TIGR03083 family)
MTDIWADVAEERNDLCDLLETLAPEQWDARSLCEEWRVRDVVAHLILGSSKIKYGKVAVDFVKSRFNLHRMLAAAAIELGREPPEDLLKQLREHAASETRPPMTKAEDMLADTLIHAQDIRRPLHKPRAIPAERVITVLETMKNVTFLGSKKRIAGLQLVASDVEWSTGDGPEVIGTGEALLMAMCGRRSVLDELSGEGVATLRSRR